jgi:hypothetical protein
MPKSKSSLDEILAEPVDLKALIEHLDFSEENIIQANREQAQLFLEASRYRVKRMRARIQFESALDVEKSEASIFLRLKKRNEKDVKKGANLTEPYMKAKIEVDPAVQEARSKFDNAQVYEEWAKLLLEAYRQRGRTIQTLAELLGAEANAQAKLARKELELEGLDNLKKAVRKRYPGVED